VADNSAGSVAVSHALYRIEEFSRRPREVPRGVKPLPAAILESK
jgi:hypothetical protein